MLIIIQVSFRRLISYTKRIVIFNVSSCIPHGYVERAIKSYGLQLSSTITFLKAGIPGDEFSHILSFSRQTYVYYFWKLWIANAHHHFIWRYRLQNLPFYRQNGMFSLAILPILVLIQQTPALLLKMITFASTRKTNPNPWYSLLATPPLIHKRGHSQVDTPSESTSTPDEIPDLPSDDTARMPPPKNSTIADLLP